MNNIRSLLFFVFLTFSAFYFLFSSTPLQAFIDYPYAVNFQTIRLPLLPLDEEQPAEGIEGLTFRFSTNWINVWSRQLSLFIIDGEELQHEATLRFAPTAHSQVGIAIPFKSQGGGVMDYYIEGFHRMAGVSQSNRTNYARNQLNVSYEPLGPYYAYFDNNPVRTYLRRIEQRNYPRRQSDPPLSLRLWGKDISRATESILFSSNRKQNVSDPRIFYQTTLWEGRGFINTIRGGMQLKLPVHTGFLIASPGVDTSIFLVVGKSYFRKKVDVRLGLSYTRFETKNYLFLRLPGYQWVIRPLLSYSPDKKWMVIGEYLFYSAPVEGFGRLSKSGHQIALGLRRKFNANHLSFAVIENFANFGVTPDIGFHAAYEARQ